MKNKLCPEIELIRKINQFIEFGFFIAILIALILRFRLIFLLNIDIDEFTFLSIVHLYLRDAPLNQFFSFHVHFFSWLPLVSENEVTQIFAARVVMYLLGLGSCIFLYLIGRIFLNRSGSLFSVLSYISISNVIIHGSSFRFDPICVFLFLCTVYFLLKKSCCLFDIIIAALSLALSMMISLKTILYLPTAGSIFLLKLLFKNNKKRIFKDIYFFLITFIIGFFLLYHFHVFTLSKGVLSPNKILNHIASEDIFFNELFPNFFYFIMLLYENIFILVFWLSGLILLVWQLLSYKKKFLFEMLLLFSLLFPIFSIAFYKYNFPYFYVFILSPGIIFSGVLIDKFSEEYENQGSSGFLLLICICSLTIIFNFFIHFKKNFFDQTIAQNEIVEMVHKIFPKPVPYIDRCSMISSYPKVGLQMTTKDMEKYTNDNTPIMKDILKKRMPIFIVANTVHLDLSVPRESRKDIFKNYPLLEMDYNLLKENFIHHWGSLYVAGKQLTFDSSKKIQNIEMLIPGIYTLESDGEISVNGVIYGPGSNIIFEQLTYEIVPKNMPLKMILKWGKDLYKPPQKASAQPFFLGYYLQALKMVQ